MAVSGNSLREDHSPDQRLKIVLSLAILFQIFCVLIIPNQSTYLHGRVSPFVDSYANSLGLTGVWSFFAPEPGPPPVYISYEAFNEEGKLLEKSSWPERDEHFLFHDRQLRRGATSQFMIFHSEFVSSMLAPYLCQRTPDIHSIRFWSVVGKYPKIEDVAAGKQRIGDESDFEHKAITLDFCDRKAKSS